MTTETTKIFKNFAQQGHYYIFRGGRAVEVVQGSETYVVRDVWGAEQTLKDLETAPKLGLLYDFQESTFLDILVMTGVTEEQIYEVMEKD